jgi:hypothetical protein
MTPDDAFLADIVAHPDDDTPRLVYADYLLRILPAAKESRCGCRSRALLPTQGTAAGHFPSR